MANKHNGNTHYIDTAGDLRTDKNVKVAYVVVTATSANAILELNDVGGTPSDKIEFRIATSGESKPFDFSNNPIVFPNGPRAQTVTNCNATIVYSGGTN